MASPGAPISRRKAAIGTFASSTATTFLVAVQALALMPLYLSHVGPRLYGGWLATGDLLVLMLAFDMGIPNLLIQRIGASLAASDQRAIGAYFGTGASILVAFAAVLGAALCVAAPFVPGWVHLTGSEAATLQQAFLLGSLATCLMLVNFIFQGLARGLQQTTVVNLSSFIGALLGFGLTLFLLLKGYGLLSIAIGVSVRSSVTLLGSVLFLCFGVDRAILRSLRFDKTVAREFWRLSPPMFVGGVGFSFMNNSQVLLAAMVLGPEAATIFGLTRKATELARSVLDAVGHASYGGFAHLFAAGDRAKTWAVYREVIAVYLAIALALMCAYVAVNPSLVSVWVSPKQFGGVPLTVLFAMATTVGGWSYLTLSLYRSTDHHMAVSGALLLECAVRLPLMYGLLLMFGLPGLPLGVILTGLASGMWAHRRIAALLPQIASNVAVHPIWAARAATFATGVLICTISIQASWSFVLGVGLCVVAVCGVIFMTTDPLLARMRTVLTQKLARVAG
jgi:O-antigen/teichoic acid export membrane protein